MDGEHPPRHGASVGVATLLVWPFFSRFAQEDISRLDMEDVRNRRMPRQEREQWVIHAYGDEGGRNIMRENPEDFLAWEEQERRILRAKERFSEIKEVLLALPPVSRIEETMRILCAEMTPAEEGIRAELLGLSLRCGKDYRTRYTLFKLLDECGLLEEYLADYPYKMRR